MVDMEKSPEDPRGDVERSRSRVSKETPKPPSGPKHGKSRSSKLPKNRISKLPAKTQESQSKGGQTSWSPKRLCIVNKNDSIIYSVPIAVKTMKKACKGWSTVRRLTDGNRGTRIAVMNGDDGGDIHVAQVKPALRAVVQIIHGNHTDKHYEDADPRLLFYMVLIHEALGSSSSVKSSEPGAKPTKTMPFFSHYAIEREISKLVAKDKYLYRVSNWPLLAVVADRIKSRVIEQMVRDELVLFCEAEQRGVPEGTRHMTKDSEWALIQELPLVGTTPRELYRTCNLYIRR